MNAVESHSVVSFSVYITRIPARKGRCCRTDEKASNCSVVKFSSLGHEAGAVGYGVLLITHHKHFLSPGFMQILP